MTEKYEFIDGESDTYPVQRMSCFAVARTVGTEQEPLRLRVQ
ncbi:hypothetical protein [Streptomyces sp. NPDC050704]